jgi:hypothetical protein
MRWVFLRSRSVVCPSCGSVYISKSRRKELTKFFLHTLVFTNPYRCMDFVFFRYFLIHSSHHDSAKSAS